MPMTYLPEESLRAFLNDLPRGTSKRWITLRYFVNATHQPVLPTPLKLDPGYQIVVGRPGGAADEDRTAQVDLDAAMVGLSKNDQVPSKLLVLELPSRIGWDADQTVLFSSELSEHKRWTLWYRPAAKPHWEPRTAMRKRSGRAVGPVTKHRGYAGGAIAITCHPRHDPGSYDKGGWPVLWLSLGAPLIPVQARRKALDTNADGYEDTNAGYLPLPAVRHALLPDGTWRDAGATSSGTQHALDAIAIAAYCHSIGRVGLWHKAYASHHTHCSTPREHYRTRQLERLLGDIGARLTVDGRTGDDVLRSAVPSLSQYHTKDHGWRLEGGSNVVQLLAIAFYEAGVLTRESLQPIGEHLDKVGVRP